MNTDITFSPNLFWDIDTASLDMDRHAAWIIARVLDCGTMDDWLAIRSYYGIDGLRRIAPHIRSMERESLSFIATITGIPQTEFRCYEQIQSKNTHWFF